MELQNPLPSLSLSLSLSKNIMGRLSAVLLVLMLVMVTEIGPMVGEARICESLSHRFKGPCVSSTNCASVCHTERFSGGRCRGFRRRCFCTKHC